MGTLTFTGSRRNIPCPRHQQTNRAARYRAPLSRHLSKNDRVFGRDEYVESITREEYAEWHDWLATRGTAPITTSNYRRCMRAIWNHLVDRGLNVCDIDGITKLISTPVQKSRAIEEHHLQAILRVASIRDAAIILYMASAGFRRQTVGRITVEGTNIWQRPDGNYRIVSRIPAEKTSPPRVIMGEHESALACKLWLAVREHKNSPNPSTQPMMGDRSPQTQSAPSSATFRNKANLPARMNINAHALRHRFAQSMLDEFDARTVSQWMGIEVNTLLQVYAYRSEDDLMRKRFGELPPDWRSPATPMPINPPRQPTPKPNNFQVVVRYN